MLVLTRKKDEKIIIDDDIVITVVEMDNNTVKIGIDAPEDIEIHREEIYRQIENENRKAVTGIVPNIDELLQINKQESE